MCSHLQSMVHRYFVIFFELFKKLFPNSFLFFKFLLSTQCKECKPWKLFNGLNGRTGGREGGREGGGREGGGREGEREGERGERGKGRRDDVGPIYSFTLTYNRGVDGGRCGRFDDGPHGRQEASFGE